MKQKSSTTAILEGFSALTSEDRAFITEVAERLHLSQQNVRRLCESAVDLQLWEEPSIRELWDETGTERLTGKTKSQHILGRLFRSIDMMRTTITTYDTFTPPKLDARRPVSIEPQHPKESILGRCPVAGEKTRCCNLQTLDAVKQCGFACSYCSIQSFYDQDRVYFHENLDVKLAELDLDEDTIYHIGTGQSSDSLMWGDKNGLLTNLFTFAKQHPNVLLELKTKAARTDWLSIRPLPENVIATWSLNAPTIIEDEEHLTSPLEARLAAARKAADAGVLVGFHFHPMVWFKGWEDEYREIFSYIQHAFSPEEVVMISLGTLTFIKPVIRQLRESGRRTRVTQIPLSDAAGKLSYPLPIKKELFSFAYRQFSREWKESVFFYMCMEDPSLWEPVFGFSYSSNDEFEEAMKQAYMKKVAELRKKG